MLTAESFGASLFSPAFQLFVYLWFGLLPFSQHNLTQHKVYYFSEVVLGEHVVGTDPDCEDRRCAPRRIKRRVSKVIVHENWRNSSVDETLKKYDIALLRLEEKVPLFSESPKVL